MSDPFRLDGKRLVVTGASRGLGRATVHTLVERGAEVLAVARTSGELTTLAANTGCSVLEADVTEGSAPLVRWLDERGGGLDGLVNNAGINIRKSLADTTDADLDALLGVNLKAVFA